MGINKEDILEKETLSIIQGFLDSSENLKNAYFWSAPSHAWERRRMEAQYEFGEKKFFHKGHEYYIALWVSCSCNHVYVTKEILKDGEKTNQTVLRTLIRRHNDAIATLDD